MSKPRLKSPPYQHSSSWAAMAIPAIPCELYLAVSAFFELGSHSLAAILCEFFPTGVVTIRAGQP